MFSTLERRPGCPLRRRGRAALGSHPHSAGQVSAARGAASPIGADGGWRGRREGGGEWSRCPDPIAGERTSGPGEAQGREREAERRCAKGTRGAAGRARMSASPGLGRPRLGVVLRASGATGERRSTRGAQGGCSRTCCWRWRRGRGRQGVRCAPRVAANPAELSASTLPGAAAGRGALGSCQPPLQKQLHLKEGEKWERAEGKLSFPLFFPV